MRFRDVHIRKDDISIFCSGDSTFSLTLKDITYLKSKTYTIALNLMRKYIATDMAFWSDRRVTGYYDKNRPGCVTVAAAHSFNPGMKYGLKVDFTYELSEEKLADGKYTLWYLLQMLHKYMPEKRVFIFGMDCKGDDARSMKVDEEGEVIVKNIDDQRVHLKDLPSVLKTMQNNNPSFFNKMYNCSKDSLVYAIKKVDFREKLGG